MRRTIPTTLATVSTSPTRLHQPQTVPSLFCQGRQTNLSTHRRATRTLLPLTGSITSATVTTGTTEYMTHRYLRALLWNRTTVMLLHDFADRYSTPRYVGQLRMAFSGPSVTQVAITLLPVAPVKSNCAQEEERTGKSRKRLSLNE